MIKTACSVIAAATVAACLAGCDNDAGAAKAARSAGAGGNISTGTIAGKAVSLPPYEGVVVETTNAGRYTYVRMTNAAGERWVAMRETEVFVGSNISVVAGAPMTNFHSAAMGRTFDTIYFSPGLSGAFEKSTNAMCAIVSGSDNEKGLRPGHPTMMGVGGMPSGGVFTGRVVEVIQVSKYTYVQASDGANSIWAAAAKFDVSKGDKVEIQKGMSVRDFVSPTLKRKFDLLYMVDRIPVTEKATPSK